jgi:hypothetical protein
MSIGIAASATEAQRKQGEHGQQSSVEGKLANAQA